MPTIKHVGNHTDQLHDGRPIPPEAVRTITNEELALPHYQDRIAASTLIVTDDHTPPTIPVDGYDDLLVDDILQLLDVATPEHFAAIKAYEKAHKDRKAIREHQPTNTEVQS
ncbi:MAG: hypothetical protein JWM93_867 [Frankiales bacterium]|nr:hypothetical protein [Frankiales bacterium]